MFLALFSLLIVNALLCLVFYQRLALIMERLKLIQKERRIEYRELFRFETERKAPHIKQEAEHYLKLLEKQTVLMMKRAKLVINGLFCFILALCSITFSLFCSLLNGTTWDFAMLSFFILGLLLFIAGLVFVLFELKFLLNPIREESEFVQRIIKDQILKDA